MQSYVFLFDFQNLWAFFYVFYVCIVCGVLCVVFCGCWWVAGGGRWGRGAGFCVDVVWDLIVGCMMTFSFDVLGLLYGEEN